MTLEEAREFLKDLKTFNISEMTPEQINAYYFWHGYMVGQHELGVFLKIIK